MILLERRAPAGVVDHDVEKEPPAALMHAVGEFAKLIDARGELVEFHERRIDADEFLTRVGTAETAKAREGRGRGIDGQQMENAAAERAEDVRQFAREIAQFSRGRDDGVAVLVEELEALFEFFVAGFRRGFSRTEHAREGAVNRVRRAIRIRMHRDAEVRTARPMLAAEGVERVRFRAEIADLGQRHRRGPAAVFPTHRHIVPRRARQRRAMKMRADDFPPEQIRAAQIRAQPRLPAVLGRKIRDAAPKGELRGVADVAQKPRARGWSDRRLFHDAMNSHAGVAAPTASRSGCE